MACVALGWLGSHVVACSAPAIDPVEATAVPGAAAPAAPSDSMRESGGGGGAPAGGTGGGKGEVGARCQVLVFPKTHLDFGSLVASYDLKKVSGCFGYATTSPRQRRLRTRFLGPKFSVLVSSMCLIKPNEASVD